MVRKKINDGNTNDITPNPTDQGESLETERVRKIQERCDSAGVVVHLTMSFLYTFNSSGIVGMANFNHDLGEVKCV